MKKTLPKKSKHRSILNKSQNSANEKQTGRTTSAEPVSYLKTEIQLGCGTAHLDQSNCLRTKLNLKSEKQLKRDLLRVTDQRPSLLGSQTLHPPRLFPTNRKIGNESLNRTLGDRHRSSSSLSNINVNSTAVDRVGPWPDQTIDRLYNNELLRPLKNFRNRQNLRLFSPKYYAAIGEQQNKFKFYSNTKSYIDEYRKRKGYVLGSSTPSTSLLPSSRQTPKIADNKSDAGGDDNDDQLSNVPDRKTEDNGTFFSIETISNGKLDQFNLNNVQTLSSNDLLSSSSTIKNRSLLRSEPLFTLPSIPIKQTHAKEQTFSSSSVVMRNGHLRPMVTNHQPMALSTLSTPRYSSIDHVEKAYAIAADGKKFKNTNAKLFVIESRPISSTNMQDNPELRHNEQRPLKGGVFYKLSHQSQHVANILSTKTANSDIADYAVLALHF
ncbi:unnamed protein product [Didymodactylos carnosus]|uniref:Uncharacterized protein n=1 Tax=Didymodactylos carnosus TaxID=1234261 RepID=A0A813R754_9BILA|nr:unnamed protein product [Didymodactylos carnosus]CAF0776206.1 unnamed protein product [Didymodactylos carnosus]CAF3498115.1 unnamed protein product [Didymodactylos carnosus]CAF3558766.1 unnamed protein product [Didymodactylos carnosus]